MNKTTLSILLVFLMSIACASAATVTIDSPANGAYDLDGSNIEVSCTATPSSNEDIGTLALFTSASGTWKKNSSVSYTSSIGAQRTASFTFASLGANQSIADGTDLVLGCASNDTGPSAAYSSNISINVEYPPTVTLNAPTSGRWFAADPLLNWTVSSIYGAIGAISPFQCQIWSNETGTWTQKSSGLFAVNNTPKTQSQNFLRGADIRWGVKCGEFNDFNVANFSENRTMRFDDLAPSVSITNTDGETSDGSFAVTYTVTEDFPAQAILYGNFNGSASMAVVDRMEAVSGSNTFNVIAQDGTWTYLVSVNNTANTFTNSSSKSVTIDTLKPNFMNVQNYSISGRCDAINVTWDTNESTTYTIHYGTTTATTSSASSSSSGRNNSYILNFGNNAETVYYFNVTSCDAANNCNQSNQFQITMPAKVCSGWTHYAVYDASINLSTIASQSGASLVYFWNQTKQNWVFHSSGSSSNAGTVVGTGTHYPVVQLYTETNNTWYRTQTNRGVYRYNVTVGDNYLVVPGDFTFGNLTESFMNASRSFPSKTEDGLYGPFNLTNFAGFNSTSQNWVNHQYNFTWANATALKQRTSMEVFWVWSDFNVTWTGAKVDVNWTRY